MSQIAPACVQCGGTEYVLESGYFFCLECQMQSQDLREEVFDEYWGGQKSGRLSIAATAATQETATQEVSVLQTTVTEKSLTSWEVLNIVLKGLVDELTLLGAPKEFKLTVLQLWASYLMKTETAFISKLIEKKPRLGLNFRKRDAKLIYGMNNELINVHKKPIYRKKKKRGSIKSSERQSSTHTSARIEKYRLTMKKKKLAKAEYERSSVSSQASEITLESLSGRSSASSQKSYKLHYNKKAKIALSNLLDGAMEIDENDRYMLQKRVKIKDAKSVEHASMSKLLAILRLALLILDSNIHLGDILRWSDEGYLSLLTAEKFLPTGLSFGQDVMSIFVSSLNSRSCINKNVKEMSKLLGVVNVSPRILPLIERYLRELQLPDDLLKIIKMFIELSPPKLKLTASVNYEGRAMAYIIFALKFMFGLDGVTEKKISKIVNAINRKRGSDARKLFSWSDWVRYINCRNSVVSVHHQATRDQYHPASTVGGSKSFLSHWEQLPTKHNVQRRHVISPNVKDYIRRYLKDLCQDPSEPFHPSLSPKSSILMDLFDRGVHIPERARKILEREFLNDSIDYLYDTAVQEEISTQYDISFKEFLAAEIIQVKPVVLEGNSVKPSLRGNKELKVVEIVDKQGKSKRKRKQNPELDMKRGFLPDSNDFLQGVKLKDESESEYDNEADTLPSCGRRYWIYHGAFSNIRTQIEFFYHIAECVFPTDFFWLLKEASSIAHICPRDLYTQLSYVEKMYLEYITKKRKPRKFFFEHW